MTKLNIVDENDNIIGYKENDSLQKRDIYRVAALWVTNSRGKILIARRHRTKSHFPLRWAPAVAGTVDKDESYEKNIIKEAKEELGLENIKPELGPKVRIRCEYNHFTQLFTLEIDKDISEFKIQEDEVEEIKWISKEELLRELKTNPKNFTPGMQKYSKLFLGG